ncbi:cubilin-like [Branchiostoma floridae]|uniref:Cubilin-like n=1 Tax=Branchiostoma floridae TaxID=7739 RepID=A0A9J7MII1_BRAFL|nr:cubilin-like [Branchiostoma floridae]
MAIKILVSCLVFLCCFADGWTRCSRSRPHKACGRSMTSNRGTFKSPGFPRPYLSADTLEDRVCTWLITLPSGKGIKLLLYGYDFAFERLTYRTHMDELQVFRDEMCGEESRIRQYQGNDTEYDIIHIPSNTACIRFFRRTTQNHSHTGFSMSYEAVDDNGECGTNGSSISSISSQEGYIRSPGYPAASYPQHINCTWVVQVSPSQTVQVEFLDFQLSYIYSCDFAPDFVQIGSSNRTYELKYCDQDTPSIFTSKKNMVWLFFKTGRWRNRGFLVYYKAIGGSPRPDISGADYWTSWPRSDWRYFEETRWSSTRGFRENSGPIDAFAVSRCSSTSLQSTVYLILAILSSLTLIPGSLLCWTTFLDSNR